MTPEQDAMTEQDAEEILWGLEFFGQVFMFDADQWYEALAFLMAERSPA